MTLPEAKKKIMDYVARRDHSAHELREKLSGHFQTDVIDEAMGWAEQQNWLVSADTLKNDIIEKLNRRGQGNAKINEKLAALGLGHSETSSAQEYEKAKKLALEKWSPENFVELAALDRQKLTAKIARFLSSRGFDSEIVLSVINNELKAGDSFHDEEY